MKKSDPEMNRLTRNLLKSVRKLWEKSEPEKYEELKTVLDDIGLLDGGLNGPFAGEGEKND